MLPIYLYRESLSPGHLVEMVAKAWRLRLVVGIEQLVSVLRDTMSSGSLIELLAREVEPLGALLPRELVRVLDLSAKCAVEGRPAGEVAEGMNLTREDLRLALARAGWPPPKVIITWLRRILAAILREKPPHLSSGLSIYAAGGRRSVFSGSAAVSVILSAAKEAIPSMVPFDFAQGDTDDTMTP